MKWKERLKQELQIPLGTKVTLAMASLVSLSLIIATGISLYRTQQTFRLELEQKAEVVLDTLTISTADSIYFGNVELIKDIINELTIKEVLLSSRAYQKDGRIIANTENKELHGFSLEPDPLGKKILQSKTTLLVWQEDRLIAGKPLILGNEVLGAISVELPTKPLKQKLAEERNQSLILALITATITSLIAYYWSRSITEPLKQMITATQYLACGGLDHQITVTSNDEFAVLADTFNNMTAELSSTVKDLELRAAALNQSETIASDQALQLKITLDQLQNAKAAAESANKAKSTFLSNMSHELRTPLNGILGYAQILRRDRTISTQQIHGLKIIYESGKHLLTLINDILDLSKIEARKLELEADQLDCHGFLNSITDLIRMQALNKDILFECLLSPSLPPVIEADEKRLKQLLLNLLGNAVKFTDYGKVTFVVSTIETKIDSDQSARHEPNQAMQTLSFEVSDTGVGMSPKQLKKIFQPFEQVGNAEHRAKGTGLGLAISKELAKLMGGEIKVESKLAEGSTFWFEATFPVVETGVITTQSEEMRQIVGYQGRRRQVLIVDDKEENRLVMQTMLQTLGFETTLAENGQQAIDLAQQIKPDCIFTDLVMPIKTGFEAVKEIRQIPEIQDVIIIAISASVLDADRKKSRIAGCEAFLPKPVEEDKLLSLLEKYLQLSWIYEEIPASELNAAANYQFLKSSDLVIPPQEEIKVLYELAMLGSMKKITERAIYLENKDDRYLCFAQKLQQLAQGFQEKAIVSLIEQYLP